MARLSAQRAAMLTAPGQGEAAEGVAEAIQLVGPPSAGWALLDLGAPLEHASLA